MQPLSLSDIPSKVTSRTTQTEKNEYFSHVLEARKDNEPHNYDVTGQNELHWAALLNQIEKVAELVANAKINVNATTRQRGNDAPWHHTPLMLATINKHEEVVKILVGFQADHTIRYKYTCTNRPHNSFLFFMIMDGSSAATYARDHNMPEILRLFELGNKVGPLLINDTPIKPPKDESCCLF